MKRSLAPVFVVPLLSMYLLLSTPTVHAADDALPTVNLAAQGRAEADNDLARAQAYAEVSGANAKAVAESVNQAIAAALDVAKRYPAVTVKTSQTSTWPVYAKNSRTISAWRMRSALSLESRDIAALSTLVGELQASLAIDNVQLVPAPDTLAKAEDIAMLAALQAFEQRAGLIAKALNTSYRIKTLDVGTQHMPRPVYRAAMAEHAVTSAPAPIEAGQSEIIIQVNGSIELVNQTH